MQSFAVYNAREGSLYVHHDFLLPAFPLCIEWLDHETGHSPGNYCAIGTMDPVIDVWDLDIINCLEPAYSLGKKQKKKKNINYEGHSDAVLSLSWNSHFHHVLASGSVDTTILLWDLDQCKPSVTIKSFIDKVQCLEWHKLEAQTLLAGLCAFSENNTFSKVLSAYILFVAGGCDKSVRSFDCRTPETHLTWTIQGEAEKVTWNPLQPYAFFAGTSEGIVHHFDIRKGKIIVFILLLFH